MSINFSGSNCLSYVLTSDVMSFVIRLQSLKKCLLLAYKELVLHFLVYCNIVSFISLVLYSLDVIIWKKKMSKYLLQMAWKSINEPIKCTKWIEIVWRIVTPEKCITNDFHQSAKSISLLNVMANQRRTMKWVSMLAQQRGKKLFNEIIKMVSQNNIVHRMEVAPREPFNLHTNPFG